MITHRIDLVQDYINDYQKSVGSQEVYPDFGDLDYHHHEIITTYEDNTQEMSSMTFKRGR
jgi:hypothetical protein